MKRRKILFGAFGIIILCLILVVVFFSKNDKDTEVEERMLYLGQEDSRQFVCYDTSYNIVSCSDSTVFTDGYVEKKLVQKVLVQLNETDKAFFYVLKGNVAGDEDLLLLYDGLYTVSSEESYYTYDRVQEVLSDIDWDNAKVIRMLTEDEADILGCTTRNGKCDWLLDEPENITDIDNSIGGHYGFGFWVSNDLESDDVSFINLQGYLVDFSDSDDTHGLRPVIQINSKYVELYMEIDRIFMKKDNQLIYARFENNKLTNIEITNIYKVLTKEEYTQLLTEIDSKNETESVQFDTSQFFTDGYYGLCEYIYIDCDDIELEELKKYISINSLNVSTLEFVDYMKKIGYTQNN